MNYSDIINFEKLVLYIDFFDYQCFISEYIRMPDTSQVPFGSRSKKSRIKQKTSNISNKSFEGQTL